MEVISVKKKNLNQAGYKNFEDWAKNKDHLYIGRNMNFYIKGAHESKWKNPFPIKKYGLDMCLELFEKHIRIIEIQR